MIGEVDIFGPKELATIAVQEAVKAGELPEEMGMALTIFIQGMDDDRLAIVVGDAVKAKRYLDAGDKEKARSIIEPHRETAEAFGLTAMFDEMLAQTTD